MMLYYLFAPLFVTFALDLVFVETVLYALLNFNRLCSMKTHAALKYVKFNLGLYSLQQ